MNIDDIKKGLECCSNPSINSCKDCPYNNNGEFSCCDGEMCKDALNLITEQEKKIERLKDENKENCWKCIEAKRVTEEDYAKLQEEFANYQIASDKEIMAQKKQAVKEFAEKLKDYINDKIIEEFFDMAVGIKYFTIDIDEFEEHVDELLEEYK